MRPALKKKPRVLVDDEPYSFRFPCRVAPLVSVLIYLRGGPHDGCVMEVWDDRPHWMLPHTPERHGAFYFGTSLGPLPQPSLYQRAFPREFERVLTQDLIVKKGTLLDDFAMEWAHATIFNCISEGGR